MRPRKLKASDVTFTVQLEQEDMPVRGHFATGEDDLDRKLEQEICDALDAGNVEAWCSITVTATWAAPDGTNYTGHDHLGCCSHLGDKLDEQVEQTVEAHDMRGEALRDLNAEIAAVHVKARRTVRATRA